jgi:hypothetical protein
LFPVIRLSEEGNKQYTYTNKVAGFYLGNSHQENQMGHDGWTVNEFHYLKDYRIFLNSTVINRDSINQFVYYPFSFIRKYNESLTETFTLLDSLNVIIWEFESSVNFEDFAFEPLLHRIVPGKKIRLSEESAQIIFSSADLSGGEAVSEVGWMGFYLISENSGRIVVLAAIDDDEERLSQSLIQLSKTYKKLKEARIQRISVLINLNNTHTNLPELSDALIWAQLSLDALVTNQRGKGIWAGLPWFNNYWGRDTFISFAGALLISGQFEEARQLLKSFSSFQLKD